MEFDWERFIQVCGLLLSWPSVSLFVALVYRRRIFSLLERVKNLQGFGAVAELSPPSSSVQQNALTEGDNSGITSGAKQGEAPIADPLFDSISRELKDILDKQLGSDENLKLRWTLRMWAISDVMRRHELNYRLIFGSQIALLKFVNRSTTMNINDAEKYYNESVKNENQWSELHKDRSFTQWIDFLLNTGYIKHSDTGKSTITLSDLGRDFLLWMVRSGVSDEKAG